MKREPASGRPLYRLSVGLLLLGLLVAVLWVVRVAPFDWTAWLSGLRGRWLLALPMLTVACLLARFFRWQFLLRSAGILVPIRENLSIYGASLIGIATPGYVGEALRSVFLKRRFGWPLRATLPVLVLDRLFDVTAIALLGGLTALSGELRLLFLVIAALSLALVPAVARLSMFLGAPETVLSRLARGGVVARALTVSVVAWLAGALTMAAATGAVGLDIPILRDAEIFVTATLLGALTLMPAGVGAMGSIAIVRIGDLGIALEEAVLAVSVFRLGTTGLALLIGLLVLIYQLRRGREMQATDSRHFDEIADEYLDQFSPHIWDLLLRRRMKLLSSSLDAFGTDRGLGLDLGCGVGAHSRAMADRGYAVVGVDAARRLLRQARRSGVPCLAADAGLLPVGSGTLDYVFTVGVLHHLHDAEAQAEVCREVARVLRPGGVFVVQETNTRNPLFRLYMGYIFPLLKSIDEGTERWIEPERWAAMPGFELRETAFFTFLPDFAPRVALPALRAVERRLERGRLRSRSVHYQAVLVRS